MTTIRSLKLALASVALGALVLPAAAQEQQQAAPQQQAQQQRPGVSLQDVLNAARQTQAEQRRANQEREQRFVAERNQQAARLNQVRGQVQAAEARSDALDAQFEQNETQIGELQRQLDEVQGEFRELFGAAKSTASEVAAALSDSVISAQYPGRVEQLRELSATEALPSEEELRNLYITMMQEIVAQGQVATFNANVVNAAGEREQATITRIGPFSAFSDGSYYTMESDASGRSFLEELARQPNVANAVGNADTVQGFSGDGYTTGTIDPSLGDLMKVSLDVPNLRERIDQGRTVGYVILIVLAVGLVLGLYKWVTLMMTNAAVRGQIRKKTPSKSNPLGRVMMAYHSNTAADTETVALKLDDAVMKEIPKLESGLNLIKVFAAVAPLLGLLGTVIGMINTFQAITLFGTGDPQLMASGISEALVTTVLGLVAAIPLLLLHAFASGAARSVTNVLEEQAAGMIAEHAEARV